MMTKYEFISKRLNQIDNYSVLYNSGIVVLKDENKYKYCDLNFNNKIIIDKKEVLKILEDWYKLIKFLNFDNTRLLSNKTINNIKLYKNRIEL